MRISFNVGKIETGSGETRSSVGLGKTRDLGEKTMGLEVVTRGSWVMSLLLLLTASGPSMAG